MSERTIPYREPSQNRRMENKHSWHITRQVDLFWFVVVAGISLTTAIGSWVYNLSNRTTALEVSTKIENANIQYQLSNINTQLNQINAKLENQGGN